MKALMTASLIVAAILVSSGCRGTPLADSPAPVDARSIHTSMHCGLSASEPAAFLVENRQQWAQLARQLSSTEIGGPKLPSVDFEQERLLVVSMGQRTSGGYALRFVEAQRRPEQVLSVTVEWQQPAPGTMQAAVMTQPCQIIAIPQGDYRLIEVVDQRGQLRFRLPTDPR
jgi:hypothetical protein